MISAEKKLIAILLEMASGEFSNHGCNDFRLVDVLPNVEDRRALVKAMYEDNGDPENFDPNGTYEVIEDWWLMAYFSNKFTADLN